MDGNKLKKLREEKGLSLTKLSKLTGISKSYLSLLEHDVHRNPILEIIGKIAAVFKMKVQELVEEDVPISKLPDEQKQFVKGTLKIEIELKGSKIDFQKLKQLETIIKTLNSDST